MIATVLMGLLSAAEPAPVDRPRLEAVYAQPGFERARLRNTGALEQLMRRLKAWFDAFFESRGAETYSVITRFLVLLAAALLAGWAAVRLLGRKQGPAPPAAAVEVEARLPLDDPRAHLQRARAQLASDPRGALREGLLALLSTLERQRLARPDRVKTNRELARELPTRGAAPELSQTVERLLGGYDRAFYSLSPVDPAEAGRFLDEVERLA